MNQQRLIYRLGERGMPKSIGNKASGLQALRTKGFRVPNTMVCTWNAYQQYTQNQTDLLSQLQTELSENLKTNCTYAVRSSANVEDGFAHSFAGQFTSRLDVQGVDAVLAAIRNIWKSTNADTVQAYVQQAGRERDQIQMAVLIQEMVTAVSSGVAFSKNPVTAVNEVVIEAVAGQGERLVQSGVTPSRWTAQNGQIIQASEEAVLEEPVLTEIVETTHRIAKTFKQDVDLEWAYDGQHVYWLQMRPITNLRETAVYSNAISKEMLPGFIKPLVWSINAPRHEHIIKQVVAEIIGNDKFEKSELTRTFYFHAYFNNTALGNMFSAMGLPPDSLENMMGIKAKAAQKPKMKMSFQALRHMPRVIGFIHHKLWFGRQLKKFFPQMEKRIKAFPINDLEQASEADILEYIDTLHNLSFPISYHTTVGMILMFVHNKILDSRLRKSGFGLEDFHLTHGMEEIQTYDPNIQLAQLTRQFHALSTEQQNQIQKATFAEFQQLPNLKPLQTALNIFIEKFGYLSDNTNDFSTTTWREKPDVILNLIKRSDSQQRQTAPKPRFESLPLPRLHRLFLNNFYHRARRFCYYRERISALYAYSNNLYHVFFLELGRRLTEQGILDKPNHIFYLYEYEVRAIVTQQEPEHTIATTIQERMAEMKSLEKIELPNTIYGDTPPPVTISSENKLSGTPTSNGTYTGVSRVVKGIADFDKVQRGDVLIIPFSDVGWTPLFRHAGAVIAESGGMLSHSSIIAREYNIPAVVSVNGAMKLSDETLVTVDGYQGKIFIHNHPQQAIGTSTL
ncbi:MAG: hypothetical protein DWQ04_01240 [Chloroflexi bacterium]|nr:MAG: hypothetical protein DWQ04_01240 [Chloroflexota bacterium]